MPPLKTLLLNSVQAQVRVAPEHQNASPPPSAATDLPSGLEPNPVCGMQAHVQVAPQSQNAPSTGSMPTGRVSTFESPTRKRLKRSPLQAKDLIRCLSVMADLAADPEKRNRFSAARAAATCVRLLISTLKIERGGCMRWDQRFANSPGGLEAAKLLAAATLANLTCEEEHVHVAVAAGALDVLLQVLREGPDGAKGWAALTLAHLATIEQYSEQMVQSGALDACTQVLEVGPEYAKEHAEYALDCMTAISSDAECEAVHPSLLRPPPHNKLLRPPPHPGVRWVFFEN